VVHPQFPIPPEMLPGLMEGFTDWWERYRDRWLAAGFYAGEPGGGGVCEVPDEVEFNRMMMEWPLTPFSTIESRPLVEMDTALAQWREIIAAMAAGQARP
ncbi:MAG TPA: hypothetical protein VM450_14895, partial [Thermomicrobiales bacterium]|nr:hypothetical protein [Thermomicrobiales bacterium]